MWQTALENRTDVLGAMAKIGFDPLLVSGFQCSDLAGNCIALGKDAKDTDMDGSTLIGLDQFYITLSQVAENVHKLL